MSVEKRIMSHAELTRSITEATLAALKAGMSREDVAAVLSKIAEMVEQDD